MSKLFWANLVKGLLLTGIVVGGITACGDQKRGQLKLENRENAPRPYQIKAADEPHWKQVADAIIAEGTQYFGVPYVFGTARFDDKAFDCSSYVQFLYAHQGIELGYNSREQAVQGQEIPFMNMRRGDLMFFSDEDFPNETGLDKVRHVGIYMGDGQILHTYEPGVGVIISNIHKDEKEGEYWYEHFLFARRVIPD